MPEKRYISEMHCQIGECSIGSGTPTCTSFIFWHLPPPHFVDSVKLITGSIAEQTERKKEGRRSEASQSNRW